MTLNYPTLIQSLSGLVEYVTELFGRVVHSICKSDYVTNILFFPVLLQQV